ncbi:MAG: glycosyltransferase family 25 protein [Pseudomonadota bacterium]
MRWPIFVISLPDALDRRREMQAKLFDLGLPFTFLDAVDGRSGLPSHLEPLIDRSKARTNVWRPMTDGEFACALSHQSAYERIIEENLPGAIILEDDAIPMPGFRDFYQNELYLNADLIQLDHMKARIWPWSGQSIRGITTFYRPALIAVLATGYSITNAGARDLRNRSFPICRKADWPCDVLKMDIRLADPRLIDHPPLGNAPSFLEEQRAAAEAAETETRKTKLRKYPRSVWFRRWVRKRLSRKIS